MKKIQAIRGMSDILPGDSLRWSTVENLLRLVAIQYGYQEIRLPIVEFTDLFSRAIGETTDVVEKEMYTFLDRNGDSLTLRPEGTAGCIRAGIEHGLLYNKIQKLFYLGPMFRHERPQKGRYRQFRQFGVEAYGLAGPDIDVEIMLLANRFWQELKIDKKVELQVNSLGDAKSRTKYREMLVTYFSDNRDALDDDSKRRLETNPLRIIDSKNPAMRNLIMKAPEIFDSLDNESKDHFDKLCQMLDKVELPYTVNPRLVRGLDYYCRTVFEWWAVENAGLGAQNAVCAGGHYDNLVGEMGGKSTPALGFAIGLERLLALVSGSLVPKKLDTIYLVLLGDKAVTVGLSLAEKIRKFSSKSVIVNCGGGDLKTQLKRADKSGADIALILGEDELAKDEVLIKYLRNEKPQEKIALNDIEKL